MTENIQNLANYDPFADTGESEDLKVDGYIRNFQMLMSRYSYSTKKW
jgi:hypothetical protein